MLITDRNHVTKLSNLKSTGLHKTEILATFNTGQA